MELLLIGVGTTRARREAKEKWGRPCPRREPDGAGDKNKRRDERWRYRHEGCRHAE